MSKIGTAHIEIKPVLNDDALAEITKRITEAVRAGVEAGMRDANRRASAGSGEIRSWNGEVVKRADG